MKQANIILSLTKDHQVHKTGVTPIEVLLLVAEHHRNCGGNPVELDEKSITELKDWSVDDELRRLRGKYPAAKVKALGEVRDLNIDYKKAVELGTGLVIPSGKLAETKII